MVEWEGSFLNIFISPHKKTNKYRPVFLWLSLKKSRIQERGQYVFISVFMCWMFGLSDLLDVARCSHVECSGYLIFRCGSVFMCWLMGAPWVWSLQFYGATGRRGRDSPQIGGDLFWLWGGGQFLEADDLNLNHGNSRKNTPPNHEMGLNLRAAWTCQRPWDMGFNFILLTSLSLSPRSVCMC